MYDLSFAEVGAATHWKQLSFDDRLDIISGKDSATVVFLHGEENSGTFRYRVSNMSDALNCCGDIQATYFLQREIRRWARWIDRVDLLVVCRVLWTVELDRVLCETSRRGVPVAFDIDDLVYDVLKVPEIILSIGTRYDEEWYNHWFANAARLYRTATRCDFFLSTNDCLAERVESDFGRQCLVLPNFPGPEQEEFADEICRQKEIMLSKKEVGPTKLIGFFSGTPTHDLDLLSVGPELSNLLEQDPNTRLIIVGHASVPACLRGDGVAERVKEVGFQSSLGMQVWMGRCDVVVVPLVPSEFSDCKSEIKYVESSWVCTPVVASPSRVHRAIIEDGIDGYLARPGEWADKVVAALGAQGADATAGRARRRCRARYSGRQVVQRLLSVLTNGLK